MSQASDLLQLQSSSSESTQMGVDRFQEFGPLVTLTFI